MSNEIIEGREAQQLLDSSVLQRALDDLEHQYVDAWRTSDAADVQGRERLFHAVQCVEHFRGHLRIAVERGKLAAAQLERLKGRGGI